MPRVVKLHLHRFVYYYFLKYELFWIWINLSIKNDVNDRIVSNGRFRKKCGKEAPFSSVVVGAIFNVVLIVWILIESRSNFDHRKNGIRQPFKKAKVDGIKSV